MCSGCALLVDYDASKLSFVGLAGEEGYDFYRYDGVDVASGLVRWAAYLILNLMLVFNCLNNRQKTLSLAVRAQQPYRRAKRWSSGYV